ncbi:MAG: (d)CMP kinase [Atopobiaceae bacterium]|jgi:cytidylate kinase|nr:(d)CMP kinase [Atopobiaceae bacterium]MCH4180016.1 (d)CMP kinase [Atopobiaceae bacterium]MCH4213932.1 (d)CMP kinase [Atopobiaceae bacterium]MCH4229818.1 (d)CMP kinase [Atopobiaceae bacterium]MCH4275605.1 (d)CMP kinase [Atopobiaceae bacterium]
MIVAIDGPAGSGKSTVAKALAARDGLTYLDTGAMYRAITWGCLSRGVDTADGDAVSEVARSSSLVLEPTPQGTTVLLDGEDVTAQIRTSEVDASVSGVAAIPAVREVLVGAQRAMAADKDVVAEGRDIGTVVFPDAEVKVFLTADVSARARRRAVQREGGDESRGRHVDVSRDEEVEVASELRHRDELDSSRAASPLVPAVDAVRLDSTDLSVEGVCERIESLMEAAR